MHAADDAVGLEHEIAPRRRRNRGGIVGETERTGMGGDRPEIGRDQAVLAGFLVQFRHALLPAGYCAPEA